MYKISVIIPAYNAQKHIGRCIDSILNQTLKGIEVIIIDDESKDNTYGVCKGYADQWDNVKVIRQENTGPGLARNAGLEAATGEYIAFVDADDYIDKEMYETMYLRVKDNNADSCICGFRKVDEKGDASEYKNPMGNAVFKGEQVQEHILLNILGSTPEAKVDHIIDVSIWKNLFSAQVIKDNGITFYSDRVYYTEDTLFNLDYYMKSSCVVTIEEVFYNYIETSGSFTKTYKEDMHAKNIRFYQLAKEKLSSEVYYEKAMVRLNRLFLGFIRYYLQRIVELYSHKEAVELIREIINDETVKRMMVQYPYRQNPMKQRWIHAMIHKKKQQLIWLFVYLNIKVKR